MKIGFDYDGTLTEEKYRQLALKFLESGNQVVVITSRLQKSKYYNNEILVSDVESLEIVKEDITFTNGALKYNFVQDVDLFFDNDLVEVELIEKNTGCIAIKV
jgi:phosphoserine phosphatase